MHFMFSKDFSPEKAALLLSKSSNFYLVHIDKHGNYVYMNDYFLSRHSSFYRPHEAAPAYLALHPDDYELSYATYLKCIARPEQTFGTTLRKLDGKGGYVITYWEYQANQLPNGEYEGVIGVGYDITAFESRKEHIAFLTETLKSLAHSQSHDIRRPLANIMGLVEVLNVLVQDNETISDIADKLSQSCLELNKEFELFIVRDLPGSEK